MPLCSTIFLFNLISRADTTGSYSTYRHILESTTGHSHRPHHSFHIHVHRKPAGGDTRASTHRNDLYKTRGRHRGRLALLARFSSVFSPPSLPLCYNFIRSGHNIDSVDPIWLALLDHRMRAHEQLPLFRKGMKEVAGKNVSGCMCNHG